MVKGVFSMSCAGMNTMPDNEAETFLKGRGWISKGIIKYMIYLIEVKHWDVNKIFRLLNAKKVTYKYFTRPHLNLPKEEAE